MRNKLLEHIPGRLRPVLQSVWTFPVILTLVLLTLTVFRIHGSSIGIYDWLMGDGQSSNLIHGEARPVRSDEWMTNTPLVISQVKDSYPVINPEIGGGQDVAVVVDVPYKEWSVIFKPQNLAFFIMPAENAYAFKWWLLSYFLILAIYALVLLLFPRKILLASLLGIFTCFSPFVQWWYQSITILPIAYSLILVVLVVKLLDATTTKRKIAYSAGLFYAASCFALVMYPPFQVTCALAALGIFIAVYLDRYPLKTLISRRQWPWLAAPLVLAVLVVFAFLYTHRDAVHAVTHTVYPGARVVQPGGQSPAYLLQWPLDYISNQGGPLTELGGNQSEVSRFMFVGPLLLPALIFAVRSVTSKTKEKQSRLVRNLTYASLILFVIMLLRTFVPFGGGFYKLLGLGSIPHVRLVIAMGILNIVLIAAAVGLPGKRFEQLSLRSLLGDKFAIGTFVYVFLFLAVTLKYVDRHYHIATVGNFEIVANAFGYAIACALLMHRYVALRYIGLAGVTLWSFIAFSKVNPLYQGFGSITKSSMAAGIRDTASQKPDAKWVVSERLPLESTLEANGVPSLSGLYFYPQLALWQRYFPTPEDERIYNRFAHAAFTVDDKIDQRRMSLAGTDSFKVEVNSCDPMLKEQNVDFLIAPVEREADLSCFKLDHTYRTLAGDVGIYSRKDSGNPR